MFESPYDNNFSRSYIVIDGIELIDTDIGQDTDNDGTLDHLTRILMRTDAWVTEAGFTDADGIWLPD